jgi:two-component system nitrogen regulation response regulator GlnG
LEGTIIIADDDKSIRTVLGQALTRAGCRVKLTGTISTLWKWIEDGEGDVIVVDVMMPDGDTLDILPVLRRKRSDTPIIVMSAVNTVSTAVRAIDAGAYDYLSKPFDLSKLVSTVNMALKSKQGDTKALVLEGHPGRDSFASGVAHLRIIGSSGVMQNLYKQVAKIINLNSNILINGQSGTGKSLLAHYIHNFRFRENQPLKDINLAIMNEMEADTVIRELIEDIEKGLENFGTILLDEISNISINSQKKLLALCEVIDRVYSDGNKLKNAPQIISSTSYNLKEKILLGNFREDLYYRLNGFSLNLPTLSSRLEDVRELVEFFLEAEGFSEKKFSMAALKFLQKQEWEGNVRELKNFILQSAVLSPNIEISEDDVVKNFEFKPDWVVDSLDNKLDKKDTQLSTSIYVHLKRYFENHGGGLPAPGLYGRLLRELELPMINIVLQATKGNQLKASKLLGLNRNTLRKKIKDLNIKFDKNDKV